MEKHRVVGKRVPRVDALDKVTGRAVFGADVTLPGTLFGAVLRSPYPHARIKRLEVAHALRAEGVAAIITGEDLLQAIGWAEKQVRQARPYVGHNYLAWDKVVYAGQPVAAVAAVTREAAQEALNLIEVEYETLPPVLDAEEAMKLGALLLHPNLYTEGLAAKATAPSNVVSRAETVKGEVAVGFAQADVILEDTFRTERVHQSYIEPRACTAQVDSEGKVTMWLPTQGSFKSRQELSEALNIPEGRIKVVPTEVGGGFGAKRVPVLEPLCVLLARKAGRPVKMVMTREEEFQADRPADAVVFKLKMGVTRDGHLTAAAARVIYEEGAFPPDLPRRGALTSLGQYRIPHLSVEIFQVLTNKLPAGSYRAPGTPQTSFAVESMMDMLAQALGLDPLELRLRNVVGEGDATLDGVPLGRIGFRETLERVREHPAWREEVKAGQGRGLSCAMWPAGAGTATVQLQVNPDGSMALLVGSIDVTGLRTAMAQIVAEEFGLDMEEVSVATGDTETAGYSQTTAGSRTTRSTGMAAYRACQEVKAQLRERAAAELEVPQEELEFGNKRFWVRSKPQSAISIEEIARPTISNWEGPITGRGQTTLLPRAPAFAVHVAEVEVDRETGKVKVLAYTAAQDVGFALNPTLVEGQLQGGVGQGIGWALTEGYVFRQGIVQNPNFLDYRVPTAADLPPIEPVLVEVPAPESPYGARGVGETPLVPTLAAVANAIARATGVRLKELPMTPEAVFRAMKAQGRA